MQSLKINSGSVKLAINDDPSNVIEFNPADLQFFEKYKKLINSLEQKEQEYTEMAKALDANKEVDRYGLPLNMQEQIDLLKDVCGYMKAQIDFVFGQGVSQKVFGEMLTLDMFEQFFQGITRFIEEARNEKIGKYTRRKNSGVMS